MGRHISKLFEIPIRPKKVVCLLEELPFHPFFCRTIPKFENPA